MRCRLTEKNPPPQRNKSRAYLYSLPFLTKAVNRRIFSAISKGALYFYTARKFQMTQHEWMARCS